MTEVIMHLLHY